MFSPAMLGSSNSSNSGGITGTPTGFSFPVVGLTGVGFDDNSLLFCCDALNTKVRSYGLDGVYTGSEFTPAGALSTQGIGKRSNGDWLIVDPAISGDIRTYPSNFVGGGSVQVNTSAQGEANPVGVCEALTEILVVGSQLDSILRYSGTGTFIDSTLLTAQGVNPRGICFDGEFIWVIFTNGDVFQYDSSRVATGFSFVTSGNFAGATDITYANNRLYISSFSTDMVYEYR